MSRIAGKRHFIIVTISLLFSNGLLASPTLQDFLPEFAGRGNIMGGAEFCDLKERHAFREQTLRLIRESGLTPAEQQQLIKAFETELKDGIEMYKQTDRRETCEAIKHGLNLMSEEEIALWKKMNQTINKESNESGTPAH